MPVQATGPGKSISCLEGLIRDRGPSDYQGMTRAVLRWLQTRSAVFFQTVSRRLAQAFLLPFVDVFLSLLLQLRLDDFRNLFPIVDLKKQERNEQDVDDDQDEICWAWAEQGWDCTSNDVVDFTDQKDKHRNNKAYVSHKVAPPSFAPKSERERNQCDNDS